MRLDPERPKFGSFGGGRSKRSERKSRRSSDDFGEATLETILIMNFEKTKS